MLAYLLLGAALADTPVVTLVPAAPIDGTRAESTTFQADSDFPAGTAFVLRVPVGNSGFRGGVHVWPRQDAGCGTRPAEGSRQHHSLALSASTDGKALQATIPPLQIGVPYCVGVDLTWPFGDAEWKYVSARLGDQVTTPGADGYPDCSPASLRDLLVAAARTELGPWKVDDADVDAAVDRAVAELALGTGATACADRARLEGFVVGETLSLEAQGRTVDLLAAGLAATPLIPVTFAAPLVNASGTLEPVSATLAETDAVPVLAAALDQVNLCADAACREWEGLLSAAIGAPDAETRTKRLKSLRARAPKDGALAQQRPGLTLYSSTKAPVDLYAWLRRPGTADLTIASAVEQLGQVLTWYAGDQRVAIQALRDGLSRYLVAAQSRATLVASLAKHRTELKTANDTLRTAIVTALRVDAVRNGLEVPSRAVPLAMDKPGGVVTPPAANYLAIQGGIGAAVPVGVQDAPPWAVPYLAFNLYAVAVDREIALGQLVGSPLLQRLSFTFGLTLNGAALEIPDRTVSPMYGDLYPIVGASLRLSNYTNLTGGAVLYRLSDPSLASSLDTLRPAPFLALSLDADLIKLITDAL